MEPNGSMSLSGRGRISDEQFKFLRHYLSSRYGLRIPAEKKTLFESRLIGRLNFLKMETIQAYFDYIFQPKERNNEYQFFIDQITTHKTFFFRENYQFEFITKILPDYWKTHGSNHQLSIWSAGCSTGEEVYTLGMILNEKKGDIPNLDYKIVGTDISIPSLRKAAAGIFSTELEALPEHFKKKYFLETENGKVLQFNHADITRRIQLGVLNLNNPLYHLPHTFDFIFCRNVTIYFDAKTREEVLTRIVDKLKPGGYLFLGHSETALGTTLPIKSIQPTIYQKQ
jgi:chemotaxis protein methyltransferase CheR